MPAEVGLARARRAEADAPDPEPVFLIVIRTITGALTSGSWVLKEKSVTSILTGGGAAGPFTVLSFS